MVPFKPRQAKCGGGSSVSITLPADVAPTTINGVTGHWIRVQIAGGNYGEDARYVSEGNPPVFTPMARIG